MSKPEQKLEASALVAGADNISSSGTESVTTRGGTDHKNEVSAKTIRIRQETYDRLKKRGEFGMDFDDVVT